MGDSQQEEVAQQQETWGAAMKISDLEGTLKELGIRYKARLNGASERRYLVYEFEDGSGDVLLPCGSILDAEGRIAYKPSIFMAESGGYFTKALVRGYTSDVEGEIRRTVVPEIGERYGVFFPGMWCMKEGEDKAYFEREVSSQEELGPAIEAVRKAYAVLKKVQDLEKARLKKLTRQAIRFVKRRG